MQERGFEIRKMTVRPMDDSFARPFGIRGTGSICYVFERKR